MKNNEKLEKLLALLSFFVSAICSILCAVFYEKAALRNGAIAGFAAAFAVFLVMSGRNLRRKKTIKDLFAPLLKKMRSLYNKVASRVKKLLPKQQDDKLFVKGKDEIRLKFAFSSAEKSKKKKSKIKPIKYSSLENDKEKIRFMYTAFLHKKTAYGYRVNPASTPDEIRADFNGNDTAQSLFKLYPAARYAHDEEELSPEILAELEEKIKP